LTGRKVDRAVASDCDQLIVPGNAEKLDTAVVARHNQVDSFDAIEGDRQPVVVFHVNIKRVSVA
jgi:hypothetical protein